MSEYCEFKLIFNSISESRQNSPLYISDSNSNSDSEFDTENQTNMDNLNLYSLYN